MPSAMGSDPRRMNSSSTLPWKPQDSKMDELTNLIINTVSWLKLTTCLYLVPKLRMNAPILHSPFAPVAFTRKILDQIFVTYKCWTKINKPASRFSVQIYLFTYLFTVSVKILMKWLRIWQDTCSDRYPLSYYSTTHNCKSCTQGMTKETSNWDTYHILQQRENPKH